MGPVWAAPAVIRRPESGSERVGKVGEGGGGSGEGGSQHDGGATSATGRGGAGACTAGLRCCTRWHSRALSDSVLEKTLSPPSPEHTESSLLHRSVHCPAGTAGTLPTAAGAFRDAAVGASAGCAATGSDASATAPGRAGCGSGVEAGAVAKAAIAVGQPIARRMAAGRV